MRYVGPILRLESVAYEHELRCAAYEAPLPVTCCICCRAHNRYGKYNAACGKFCRLTILIKMYAIRSGGGAPQDPTFIYGLALHVAGPVEFSGGPPAFFFFSEPSTMRVPWTTALCPFYKMPSLTLPLAFSAK